MSLSKSIEQALRTVLPARAAYTLHEPEFNGNEWAYVKDCLDTGWVSSVGAYVDRFEQELAAYTGIDHAIVCVNGTAALHVALGLAGVCRDDEVLIPALTFVATANAVVYCGAAPVFVDSSTDDFGIDIDRLRDFLAGHTRMEQGRCINRQTGRTVRAIVPVHVFGHPCRMDRLKDLCAEFGIAIVEDATEALGTRFLGKHVGGWGSSAVLSFNGNKIITTGGGGALLTNDAELARRAKHLTTTAKVAHGWEFVHDEVGYNYRLPNINAALGCAQLERMDDFVSRKRELAERYAHSFEDVKGVRFVREPAGAQSNYWLNAILLDAGNASQRDAVIGELVAAGIHVRPVWNLLCDLPMYAHCQVADTNGARDIAARTINLPSSPELAG